MSEDEPDTTGWKGTIAVAASCLSLGLTAYGARPVQALVDKPVQTGAAYVGYTQTVATGRVLSPFDMIILLVPLSAAALAALALFLSFEAIRSERLPAPRAVLLGAACLGALWQAALAIGVL